MNNFLSVILVIIILNYLRKKQSLFGDAQQKSRLILGGIVIGASLLAANFIFSKNNIAVQCFNFALIGAVFYFVYTKKAFASARPMALAFLPIMIVQFIEFVVRAISASFYKSWHNYFQSAELFAVIWMVALFIINGRQKKAIEKERLKTEEKEREILISEKMKAELEIQVKERTAELTSQKEELQQALHDLRSAQAQLVQAEKMASLGELTAGIAHEIQNPLNFVNNFSEVSNEMIDEANEELANGNMRLATEILTDIKQNLEKITHHGKRADAIVKGMLQHSRTSSGQQKPTDLNALADEYLRLAYHGIRAKDKSFNATLKTDFDPAVGKVNMVAQDVGRVILNLITNAFYAVGEKNLTGFKNLEGLEQSAKQPYAPTVSITTKKLNDKIRIIVADNGGGVPASVLDKIFQPFFTTKPTGKGTGLGLSLAYDIVKAHGGELKVETKDGEGSAFIIDLPNTN